MVEGARLESVYRLIAYRGFESLSHRQIVIRLLFVNLHCGGSIGPLATIGCKLRQARKGATVATDSCAGMWLIGPLPFLALKNS